ncbi:MAG: Argonaute siRNA chaperone complex subunit Arb1-domain-containing protein [Benniella sp.]|nr:MAG: Argonaute siRNA chaperone complex subunit Arb1-domain-containing protein [Benniella sp.]
MDLSKMTDEEARLTVSRMLEEMDRMANGGVSESEDDSDIEDDAPVTTAEKAPSTEQASSAEQTSSTGQGPSTEQTTTADEAAVASTEDAPKKKKKKKKSKKKTANLPDLEDLLKDDGPLEPEDPYDTSKSVAERVEIAVTKFRKNRKFTTERAAIFSSYLAYGGIRTGQKAFQGGAAQSEGPGDDGEPDFEAMNAGVDLVDLPEDGQVVDFTNVVTTFLTQHFLKCTGWIDMIYYKDTPVVVASLMKYFLIRNVLPEHEDDIKGALAIAERAQIELPLCKMISNGLPGRFSKACSLIYGGEWHNFFDNTWQKHSQLVETLGMDRPTAEKIVLSVFGPDVDLKSVELKPRVFLDLEIVKVELPEDLDSSNNQDETEPSSGLAPEDEAKVVEMMVLGMRVEAFVFTLSNGISYLEQSSIYPTFYLEEDEVDEEVAGVAAWDDDDD